MTKRIAIITPGGDAPGVNACIRALVRQGISHDFTMIGVYRGYEGLINGEIASLDRRSVSGIIHHGGTILKSTRCSEIQTPMGLRKAIASIRRHRLDYLIVIGGDGSFTAGLKIAKSGIPVIGIPASIDNDIYGTDETIGFDTAVNTAVEAIDKIRDTATSFDRIFLVEVMGREHGFLALSVGVASGADFIIIPEVKYDINRICTELVKDKAGKKTSEIIIFAEGAGRIMDVAKKIETKTKVPVRVSVLGYIQRGGAPSARSRILGSMFGAYAIGLIKQGLKNRAVVMQNNCITHIPLEKAVRGRKRINRKFHTLAKNLST
ncbi:MAG: 6-phosphofructokinase [Planctomycetes bacterium]|nr:6-phosphofructokinase [Planctomycetota bacterium]